MEFCGGCHTGFFRIPRALWISGESVPPALSRRSFARFARSAGFPAWLPCPFRKLSVSYFYTAGQGGDPCSLRGWRARSFSYAVSFWCPRALLRSRRASLHRLGSLSISVLIIAHVLRFVKTFFYFFKVFSGRLEEDYSSSCRRAWSSSHSAPWIS